MASSDPTSPRLRYRPVTPDDRPRLHLLLTDRHVRRFLLDGEVVTLAWTDSEIRRSIDLFRRRGVGLWLVSERGDSGQAIGFGGYRVFDDLGPEPQLLYAVLEPYTGRGYATEIATTLVRDAVTRHGFTIVTAAVDAPNVASMHVLDKAGFERVGEGPGPLGRTVHFAWRAIRGRPAGSGRTPLPRRLP